MVSSTPPSHESQDFYRVLLQTQTIPSKIFSLAHISSFTDENSGRHFPKDVILQAVCWYVSYPLSLRMIEEMFAERSITVGRTTINH